MDLAVLYGANNVNVTSLVSLGIVVNLGRHQGGLCLLQIKLGDDIILALMHVNSARMNPAKGRGFIHFFQQMSIRSVGSQPIVLVDGNKPGVPDEAAAVLWLFWWGWIIPSINILCGTRPSFLAGRTNTL